MRPVVKYLLLSLMLLSAVCACSDSTRLIPRSKFSRILAEMFLVDCSLARQPQARNVADTTLVYQAVFEKYGYDVDDYRHSQEVYIKDAKRYERMVRRSLDIIENESKELKAQKKIQDALLMAKQDLERFIPHNLYLFDSLSKMDDLYAFDPQKGMDTIFRGPQIVIPALDTLANEAVEAKDTVERKRTVKDAFEKIFLD